MWGPVEESSPWEKTSPPLSLLKDFHRPPSTYSPLLCLKRSLGTGDPSDLRPRQMASAPVAPVSTTDVRKCPAEAQRAHLTFKACRLIKLTNTHAHSAYCRRSNKLLSSHWHSPSAQDTWGTAWRPPAPPSPGKQTRDPSAQAMWSSSRPS